MTDLPVPCNLDAERAVLGALLLEPERLASASGIVSGSDFHSPSNRHIWSAITDLSSRKCPVDAITVRGELQRTGRLEEAGGVVYLARLTDGMPRGSNIEHYCREVRDAAIRRGVMEAVADAAARASDPSEPCQGVIESLQRTLLQLSRAGHERSWRPVSELVTQAYREIEAVSERRTDVLGIDTGFADLNRLTQGFKRGELVILAGRPGHGKTSLAANIIAHTILRRQSRVGLFTIEMSDLEIVKRLIYSEAAIDSYRVGGGYLSRDDWARIADTAGRLSAANLWIDDMGGLTFSGLQSRALRLASEHGLDMLVLDYLQLMRGDGRRGETREREIASITAGLKSLAKELSVPILALSQLNRTVENQARKPQLSDLRESGAIEQDADLVLFIWRDELRQRTEENKGKAELIIGKQRNGPVGCTIQLSFIKQYCRFADITNRPSESTTGNLWYQET